MRVSLAAASFLFVFAKAANAHEEETSHVWDVMTDARLPLPVSDHSSTFLPASNNSMNSDGSSSSSETTTTTAAIYIAGGCDSPDGNTYVDANGLELDFFLCNSYSDRLWAFDPYTNNTTTTTFREQASLPRKRYRHAAVSAAGKLWLIGGRTIPEDTVIAEVDVYDPTTDSWSMVGTIPEEFLTSDSGAFANANGSTIYVVGGFNPQYYNPGALATTFSFETASALDQLASGSAGDLAVTRRADLITQRGGAHAVSSKDMTKAYVAGGFSSYPCEPLTSAEVYDLEQDKWTSAGDLQKARGDGAMVEASGIIFAIGGEVSHPDQCGAPELVPPLGHQSLAVDDVEALEYSNYNGNSESGAEWADVADIPEFRFRFTAASWPDTGVVYAFGGQVSFNESCKCFPTTDEITVIDSKVFSVGGAGIHSHSDIGTSGGDEDGEKHEKPISEMGDEGYILDSAASSWDCVVGIFWGIISLIATL